MLIAQQGNECAVITTAYSPWRMEIDGQEPDWRTCPVLEIDVFVWIGGRDDLGWGYRAQ